MPFSRNVAPFSHPLPGLMGAPKRDWRTILLSATLAAGFASSQAWGQAAAGTQIAANADAPSGAENVVVTGTRETTTPYQSLVPVQVIGGDVLMETGQPDLRTALAAVVPSFINVATSNGSSSSKPVRTASLRGLGGDEVLILINGHRRHATSLLNNTTGSGAGSAPVDLALIPTDSVARVEVLTDGASAQYGSDAIAGVINIILKSDSSGGTVTSEIGVYDGSAANVGGVTGSGLTADTGFNVGYDLGQQGGFLDLSGEIRRVLDSNQDGPIGPPTNSITQIFAPGNPAELTVNRFKQHNEVVPWGSSGTLGYNLEDPLNSTITFYSNGTFSLSSLRSDGTYRSENNPATIIGTSPPGGYLPVLDTQQTDFQFNAGVRGEDLFGWAWDFSASYGWNQAKMYVGGTNASFGGAVPQQNFYVGELVTGEAILDFDLKRSFATSLFAAPLDVAAGVEYRANRFHQGPGDYYSYADGGYVFPSNYPSTAEAGKPAGIGSPFMTGFTPAESGTWGKDDGAVYVDFAQALTDVWKVDVAARFEDYSDAGGAFSGKISTRYEILPWLAFRGAINNGFRAPSLVEEYTTVANQGPFNTGTQIVQVNSYYSLSYSNPAAAALGATPLKPETSINYSAGFVAQPLENLNLSVDAYQVDITNRIGVTGAFNGTLTSAAGKAVAQILTAAGQNPDQSIQYFTNIGDTETQGLDFKADYTSDFGSWGSVSWSLSDALNHQMVTHANAPPPALAAAGLTLLQPAALVTLEDGLPKNIAKANVDWFIGRFEVSLTETYYSQTYALNATYPTNPAYNSVSPPAFITDGSISTHITDGVKLTIGATNLLNKKANNIPPIAVPLITTGYVYPAPVSVAPYGTGGAFYYVAGSFSW